MLHTAVIYVSAADKALVLVDTNCFGSGIPEQMVTVILLQSIPLLALHTLSSHES